MQCINAHEVRFSALGIQYLREIKEILETSKMLKTAVSIGVLHDFFLETRPVIKAYKLTTIDFNSFGEALQGIEKIKVMKIREIITHAYMTTSGDERLFWKGLYDGCSY